MAEIHESLVAVDVEAADAEAVIRLLAGLLHKRGAVTSEYGAATLRREQDHPTGLPTRPFPIAFPHADAEGVNRSALAVASLRYPVVFRSMEDPNEGLSVELVFLLANNNPDEQIQTLRDLAVVFSQPEKLAALRALSSRRKVAQWLANELDADAATGPDSAARKVRTRCA